MRRGAQVRRASAFDAGSLDRKTVVPLNPSEIQRKKAAVEELPVDGAHSFLALPKSLLSRVMKQLGEKDIYNMCRVSPEALIKVMASPVHIHVNPQKLLGNLKWMCKRRATQMRSRDRFMVFLSLHCYPKELDSIELFHWNIYHLIVTERDVISDIMLRPLKRLVNLQSLDLRLCNGISGDGLENVRQARNLRTLDLGWCMSLSDASIGSLSKLAVLESLDLSYCAGVNDLACRDLALCPYLQRLDIRGCTNVTGAGIKSLSGAAQLRTLILKDCFQLGDGDLVPLNDLILRTRCTVYSRDGSVLYGILMERKGATKLTQLMHRKEQPPFVYYVGDLRTVLQKHGLEEYSGVVETLRERPGGNQAPMARPKGQPNTATAAGSVGAAFRARAAMTARRDLRASAREGGQGGPPSPTIHAFRSSDPFDPDAVRRQLMTTDQPSPDLARQQTLTSQPSTAMHTTSLRNFSPTTTQSFKREGAASAGISRKDTLGLDLGLKGLSRTFPPYIEEEEEMLEKEGTPEPDPNPAWPGMGSRMSSEQGQAPRAGPASPSSPSRFSYEASRAVAKQGESFVYIPPPPPTATTLPTRGSGVGAGASVDTPAGPGPSPEPPSAAPLRITGDWRGGLLQLLRSEHDGPTSVVAAQRSRPTSAWDLHPGEPVSAFPVHLLLDDCDGPGADASRHPFSDTSGRPAALLSSDQRGARGRPRTASSSLGWTVPTPAALSGEAIRWMQRPGTAQPSDLTARYLRRFADPGVPADAQRQDRSSQPPSLQRTHPRFTGRTSSPVRREVRERIDAKLGAAKVGAAAAAPSRPQTAAASTKARPNSDVRGGSARPLNLNPGGPVAHAPISAADGVFPMYGLQSAAPMAGRNLRRVQNFAEGGSIALALAAGIVPAAASGSRPGSRGPAGAPGSRPASSTARPQSGFVAF